MLLVEASQGLLGQVGGEGGGDLCAEGMLEHQFFSSFADFAIVFVQHGFEQPSELGRKVEFQKVAYVRTK